MRTKLLFLTTLALLFGLVSSGSAATTWTGAVDQDWTNAGNWDAGVPDSGNNAYIEAGVPGAIIDDTMNVDVAKVAVGFELAGDAYLTMTGGTLNVYDRVYVGGEKGDRSSIGHFTMENGTIKYNATSGDRKFYIGYKGPDDQGYFTMNAGLIDTAGKFYIAGETADSYGVMTMNGGTANAASRVRVGGKGGIGYLYMNDGTFLCADDFGINDEDAGGGEGYLYMTGGSITTDDRFRLNYKGKSDSVAEVYLHGGIIDADRITFNDSAESGASALLDITLGSLLVSGDKVADIQDYIASGLITGYGGQGEVLTHYDSGLDKTVVTAIPEPATIALLGLGGLSLLRRRR